MNRGIGRTLTLVLGLCTVAAFVGVEGGVSQVLAVGGQLSANKGLSDDLTWGFGARAQISLPLTGITFQGTADFFEPDCGTVGGSGACKLNEVSLNLLWSLPVPFVATPYFGAGLAVQNSEGQGVHGDKSDYGANFLAGIVLKGPTFSRFRPFGEVKYQMMQDFDPQTVFSGGILLVIL